MFPKMDPNAHPAVPFAYSKWYTAGMTCSCSTIPDLHPLRQEVSILQEILHRLGRLPEDFYASGRTYPCACEEAEALKQRLAALKDATKEVLSTKIDVTTPEVQTELPQESEITRTIAPGSKRRRASGAKR